MDPWHTLRTFTQARIGQGSAGSAQRTDSLIDFQLAHAEARDAVWKEWDCNGFLIQAKEQWGEALLLNSQAQTRTIYLKRPDLGRRLSTESLETLTACYTQRYDIALIISNGLSTTAVETHAVSYTHLTLPTNREV